MHGHFLKKMVYPWQALDELEHYLKSLALGKILGKVSAKAYLVNEKEIYIGEGSTVEAGAWIKGPCWIGANSTIRHGAYIRGNVLTEQGVVIGHDTEVKNSIFLSKAHAAHFAYVGDSIIGNNVNLGAGVKCANFRLDQQEIVARLNRQKIATHRRKLGAIIGDKVQIGCNCVLNPGTIVGKETICHPCLNISGWIPQRSLIKACQEVAIIPLDKGITYD